MAYAFIKTDSLVNIADAIREKTQSTDGMTPAQMAEKIANIEAGGDVDYISLLLTNTLVTYESNDVLKVNRNFFEGASSLRSVSLPNCTLIDQYAFNNCTSLASIYAPLVANMTGSNIFYNCRLLTEAMFPNITSILGNNCFNGCTAIETIDVGKPIRINSGAFANCTSLANLIIRNTSSKCALQNVNAFTGCGTTINVYVPSSLISTYQSDSVWSAVTGATLNFVALEGSTFA